MLLNQHFISYVVWNFHLYWLFFLIAMQENKSGCFFLNTVSNSNNVSPGTLANNQKYEKTD